MLENNFKEMLEIPFTEELCKQLQLFRQSSRISNEQQVNLDLKRLSSLEIKDESGDIVWRLDNIAQSLDNLNQDPGVVFFDKIKGFDSKLQDFIARHFHQGGMLFNGRTFLSCYINSLGFQVNGDHHFVFEFIPEGLIVKEIFVLKKLTFLPLEGIFKTIPKDGELSFDFLKDDDKEKIAFFREQIENSLEARSNSFGGVKGSEIRLEENPNTSKYLHMVEIPHGYGKDGKESASLIEFTLKNTIVMDPVTRDIKLENLSKEGIVLKVQSDLYGLSSLNVGNLDFSKFLTPELPLSIPKEPMFFTKPRFKSSIHNIVLNSYREFILLLFNIIFNLIVSLQPRHSNDPQNNFSQKMRP